MMEHQIARLRRGCCETKSHACGLDDDTFLPSLSAATPPMMIIYFSFLVPIPF
jgi:hypothetical protein